MNEPSQDKSSVGLRAIMIGLFVWTCLMAGGAVIGGRNLRSSLFHMAVTLLVMFGFLGFWYVLLRQRARRQ